MIPVTAEDVARKKRRVKLIWISAFAVAAAIAGWVYKRSSDPVQAQHAFDDAQRLFDTARYDEAILSCDRAVSLRPDYAEAYLLRGRAHVALYDSEHAINDFTTAVELRPSDPKVLLERAATYVDNKNYAAAIADATSALVLDPKLARAYNLRGTARRATGDIPNAVADFSHAVEIAPNSDNYYQRGATYQMLADHRHAVEDFTQAIAWDPDKPQSYFARAESERALGEIKKADEDHLRGRVLDGR